jgi:hypothetical protein
MNPDVFITIVFVGIALMVPLVFLVFAVPQMRRENAGVQRRESRRQRESLAAEHPPQSPGSTAKGNHGAAVH